jgi:hypothetical protein
VQDVLVDIAAGAEGRKDWGAPLDIAHVDNFAADNLAIVDHRAPVAVLKEETQQ